MFWGICCGFILTVFYCNVLYFIVTVVSDMSRFLTAAPESWKKRQEKEEEEGKERKERRQRKEKGDKAQEEKFKFRWRRQQKTQVCKNDITHWGEHLLKLYEWNFLPVGLLGSILCLMMQQTSSLCGRFGTAVGHSILPLLATKTLRQSSLFRLRTMASDLELLIFIPSTSKIVNIKFKMGV